jgi:hypothetical protein
LGRRPATAGVEPTVCDRKPQRRLRTPVVSSSARASRARCGWRPNFRPARNRSYCGGLGRSARCQTARPPPSAVSGQRRACARPLPKEFLASFRRGRVRVRGCNVRSVEHAAARHTTLRWCGVHGCLTRLRRSPLPNRRSRRSRARHTPRPSRFAITCQRRERSLACLLALEQARRAWLAKVASTQHGVSPLPRALLATLRTAIPNGHCPNRAAEQ